MPSSRDDPKRMENLFSSVFVSNPQPNLGRCSTLNKYPPHFRRMLSGAEEADRLHTETPGNPLWAAASVAVPTVDPNWTVNAGDGLKLKHHGDCVPAGLRRGAPRQRSLSKVQEVRQKLNEDPSEFLERVFKAYWQYTDRDPEAPKNLRMVNMTS